MSYEASTILAATPSEDVESELARDASAAWMARKDLFWQTHCRQSEFEGELDEPAVGIACQTFQFVASMLL
jgi:hypothetical protein